MIMNNGSNDSANHFCLFITLASSISEIGNDLLKSVASAKIPAVKMLSYVRLVS